MPPLVSVLIPCYNAAPYVGATLQSVLAQTWRPLEVIVVDDGSTDASAEIVASFAQHGVKLIRQANRGQTAALNTALAAATGQYIQYLDADDLIDPSKIELQMTRLLPAPECIVSAEWGRFYDSPKNTRFEPEPVWCDMHPIDWLATSRLDGEGMMFPAIWLLPMTIVQAIGPWDETLTLNNDAEYFTRALIAAKRVLFCPGARCYYRSGLTTSLSGRKSIRAWQSQFRVIELCEMYVRSHEDSVRVRRGFALSWQHLAHASYPYAPAIARQALERARVLHPVRISPDGGPTFKLLSRLVGWRIARRLQVFTGRP